MLGSTALSLFLIVDPIHIRGPTDRRRTRLGRCAGPTARGVASEATPDALPEIPESPKIDSSACTLRRLKEPRREGAVQQERHVMRQPTPHRRKSDGPYGKFPQARTTDLAHFSSA